MENAAITVKSESEGSQAMLKVGEDPVLINCQGYFGER